MTTPYVGVPMTKASREAFRIITQDSPFELVKVPILALSGNLSALISGVTSQVMIPEPGKTFVLSVQNVIRIQAPDLRNYAVMLFDPNPELDAYRRNNGLDVEEVDYVPHAVISDNLAASPRQRGYVSNLGSTLFQNQRSFEFGPTLMVTYRPLFIYDPSMKY